MKTVQDAYEKYEIMPTLQLHQLRVASVAKIICENFKGSLDTKNVVLACLFHDMGNIIKSDLTRFPEFLEPKGFDYWKGVKDRFIQKYGPEEHKAAAAIAQEIDLSSEAQGFLNRVGFSNLEKTHTEGTFENKICSYADMRVGPYGVLSIEERLSEGQKRYAGKAHSIASGQFELLANCLRHIEKDIFANTNLKPEDLNDQTIRESIESLRNFPIN